MNQALPFQWVHYDAPGRGRGQVLYGVGAGRVRVAFADREEVVHVSVLTEIKDPKPTRT